MSFGVRPDFIINWDKQNLITTGRRRANLIPRSPGMNKIASLTTCGEQSVSPSRPGRRTIASQTIRDEQNIIAYPTIQAQENMIPG